MSENVCTEKPLQVTPEAMEVYEAASGMRGLIGLFVAAGLCEIVTE